MTEEHKKNREFAELVGICWHERNPGGLIINTKAKCVHCGNKLPIKFTEMGYEFFNPDYAADPRLVLREMKRLGKLSSFMMCLWDSESCEDDLGNVLMSGGYFLRLLDLILDKTGQLRDLAIGCLKKGE